MKIAVYSTICPFVLLATHTHTHDLATRKKRHNFGYPCHHYNNLLFPFHTITMNIWYYTRLLQRIKYKHTKVIKLIAVLRLLFLCRGWDCCWWVGGCGWMERMFIHSFSLYILQIMAVIRMIVVNLKRIRRRSLISITHIHHTWLHAPLRLCPSAECVAFISVRKSIWNVQS